jgi:3-hydroxybenzoate 6-monooxygenase
MAIEDGVCLAEAIGEARGDFAAAFQRYQAARVVRTARVQLDSRVLWEFYHAAGIAREVRALTVADWTEAHMHNCLAWLYDGAASSNNER